MLKTMRERRWSVFSREYPFVTGMSVSTARISILIHLRYSRVNKLIEWLVRPGDGESVSTGPKAALHRVYLPGLARLREGSLQPTKIDIVDFPSFVSAGRMTILVGSSFVRDDGLAVLDLDIVDVVGEPHLVAIFGRGHQLVHRRVEDRLRQG